jgi:aryl-alcohol dehydrogenase-like predicted oxidoreductase
MKLALGTVQFGLPYGIANKHGQPSLQEVARIINLARSVGIDLLDTAVAYGESEVRLGQVGIEGFKVVTKLPSFSGDVSRIKNWAEENLHRSLGKLGLPKAYGVLLHAPGQLLEPDGCGLVAALESLKDRGLVEKIGVSIYSPDELDAIMPLFPFDLVQAPFSVVDRRLLRSGWLGRLKERGVEIHARSLFLQGLLLMSCSTIPRQFSKWSAIWENWHGWLETAQMTPQSACLGFAQSVAGIDRVVVGVETCAQLEDLVRAAGAPSPDSWPNIESDDQDLLNPALWARE